MKLTTQTKTDKIVNDNTNTNEPDHKMESNRYYDKNIIKSVHPNILLESAIDCMTLGTVTIPSAYKTKVMNAFRNRRIFTLYGNLPILREILQNRGWVEKLSPGQYATLQHLPEYVLLQYAKRGNLYETIVISKIIKNFPSFFIWQPKEFRHNNFAVLPQRNRVRQSKVLDFSTEVGLIGCVEHEKWYQKQNFPVLTQPRFHRLSANINERDAFIEDFRWTQCRCIVRFGLENIDQMDALASVVEGTVDPAILQFAVTQLQRQLTECTDRSLSHSNVVENEAGDWKDFIRNSAAILDRRNKFKASPVEVAEYMKAAALFLAKLDKLHADYKWDGCRNLWILKPAYQSCGIGILLKNSLDDILKFSINMTSCSEYIAQKYIELPLLIYNTKFDFRQYMLLVFEKTMINIWFYKDCYCRFSAHLYNINDFRESIHLTNYTVSKRYQNSASRSPRLPHSNMWTLAEFKTYMKTTNAPANVWENKIYPAFQKNIIAVVLASAEETNFVENSFEFYGCDFMLDQQYNPVLIEINSSPDMSESTPVTSRICPMALRDTVRVVVDLPQNPNASTGLFESIFQIPYKYQSNFDPKVGMPVIGITSILHEPVPEPEPIVGPVKPANKGLQNIRSLSSKKAVPKSQPGRTPVLSVPNTTIEGIQASQPVQLQPIQPDRPIRRFRVKRFLRKLVGNLI